MRRGVASFFRYARARHQIYLDRAAGKPRPWTSDPILRQYRFTNVFRELDKTTVWFRQHVRDLLRDDPKVLLATVVFRMLNRVEVGEAIFCQTDLEYANAFEHFCVTHDARVLRRAVQALIPNGPYCTGAYIISSPPGYSKLDGVLEVIKRFTKGDYKHWLDNDPAGNECSLQAAWEWLKEHDYFGPFHSYEIVTDLRHTALLARAPDVMTWANPGPGARRGLNRVHDRDVTDKSRNRDDLILEMREVLALVADHDLWPNKWPRWELREVEHTMCEFDKYCRVKNGEGTPRGVFS